MDNIELPENIKALSGTSFEGWHFLESNDVRRRAGFRQHMIPLATQYAGLGLYRVLEYVPQMDGFFIHTDGGSNGYDRADNAARWNAYSPSNNEILLGPIQDAIRDDANSSN
jgi:hypothetical protein